ncbi:uncharacterized protein LOC142321914 [Lycorma delicatula]|uniref:uncharacterized protein LOC142321914 n=1 Tax=Lycorma delicatula TaxID=130591 RepID=UPI003F51923E
MYINKIPSSLLKSRSSIVKIRRLFSDKVIDSSFPNPPGLSNRVIKPPSGKIGPGASKDGEYKNPEYFSYHRTSYFEAEIEMAKYRLPQPSPFKKES